MMKTITRFLNIAGLAAMLFPIFNIINFEFQLNKSASESGTIQFASATVSNDAFQEPDIYYIILDGYGRSDVIGDLFQVDNEGLIHFLEENDFFVGVESRSNYIQTSLSIASSLNMDYLDNIEQAKGELHEDRLQLIKLIRESEIRHYLERRGYQFISVSSAYLATEIDNADFFLQNSQLAVNPLEGLLMETSGLIALQDAAIQFGWKPYFPGFEYHRNQVIYSFETLSALKSYPSPKFVFSHIVSPHPPFVFGPDGEEVSQVNRYTLRDGNAYFGTSDDYIQGYRDQLTFVSKLLEELISQILENSEIEPIIIIQADHGSGLRLNYQSCEDSDLHERFSILNAYYFQGRDDTSLYESITPVNTFRVVLNEFFDENIDLLQDRNFCSTWETPFEFQEFIDQP